MEGVVNPSYLHPTFIFLLTPCLLHEHTINKYILTLVKLLSFFFLLSLQQVLSQCSYFIFVLIGRAIVWARRLSLLQVRKELVHILVIATFDMVIAMCVV